MADFDPLTVPAVMPMSVRRTNEGGFPAQAMLDYEQALQQWMKSNVTNTNTRLNLVSEEVDGAYAAISTEATTRATADGALASDITAVEVAFDGFTANGEVYFAAVAGPAGSAAAYGIYLTAGNVFTGLMLVAQSGGGSYIAMTAGKLYFFDNSSGNSISALTYSGGKFVLNGAVSIQSSSGAGSFDLADGLMTIRDASSNIVVELGLLP